MKFINSNLKALSKLVLLSACCVAISFAAGCSGSEAEKKDAGKTDSTSTSEPAGSGTSAPAGSDKK